MVPVGGLLGGSGAGKTSKLAALAKARKAAAGKNQQETPGGESGEKSAVSLLSKLAAKRGPTSPTNTPTSPTNTSISPSTAIITTPKPLDATLHLDAPKSDLSIESPHAPPLVTLSRPLSPPVERTLQKNPPEEVPVSPSPGSGPDLVNEGQRLHIQVEDKLYKSFVPELRASPSQFAISMFGEKIAESFKEDVTNIALFYYSATVNPPAGAFSGPSPDDVVIAAQSQAKGICSHILFFPTC